MLAPVRRPDHSELSVYGGACRRRAVKFAANPFAILVLQQSKKILVVPGERTGSQSEQAMHPVIPPNHASRHVQVPGSHLCGTERETHSIRLAVAVRVAHRKGKNLYFLC